MTFGERVELRLQELGLTQADLARAIGRKPAIVSHWLTGRRRCPPPAIAQIAAVLRVNRAWLAYGDAPVLTKPIEGTVPLPKRDSSGPSPLDWYFRHAPVDGGRDFGNANTYATPPDVTTFVRELGQNSTDAAYRVGGSPMPVVMRFSLIELTRGSERYERFLAAARFSDVETHITQAVTVAAGRSKLAAKLRDGLRTVRDEERLILLRVDDYGTVGLYGDELGGDNSDDASRSSPYAALVRNNLDSSKEASTAGGSYGLGKAVLWNCSTVSTVLFSSRLPNGEEVRVTGRTELTWHRVGEQAFAGPGWFGIPQFGASVWTQDPGLLADLCLDRDERLPPGVDRRGSHGTSALVIGFRDPESEGIDDVSDLAKRISAEVAENFFPAIQWGRLRVFVDHVIDGELRSQAEVLPDAYVPEFCEALRSSINDEVVPDLIDVGTTARRGITQRIPQTRSDAEGIEQFDEVVANAHLIVRLDEDMTEGSLPELTNSVAMVRGRGMVARFWPREGVAMGAKPFHAILLAGEAVSSETPQRAAEQFLRLAEPPAHDDWEYRQELKAAYRLGARQRLEEFKRAITEELRKTIQPQVGGEAEGPEELKRLLNFGAAVDPAVPLATLRNIRTQLTSGAWLVEAEIHFNDKTKHVRIVPRAWIDVESGAPIRIPWQTISYTQGREDYAHDDGAVIMRPGGRTLHFRAVTNTEVDGIRVADCRAKVDLSSDIVSTNHERVRDAAQ